MPGRGGPRNARLPDARARARTGIRRWGRGPPRAGASERERARRPARWRHARESERGRARPGRTRGRPPPARAAGRRQRAAAAGRAKARAMPATTSSRMAGAALRRGARVRRCTRHGRRAGPGQARCDATGVARQARPEGAAGEGPHGPLPWRAQGGGGEAGVALPRRQGRVGHPPWRVRVGGTRGQVGPGGPRARAARQAPGAGLPPLALREETRGPPY